MRHKRTFNEFRQQLRHEYEEEIADLTIQTKLQDKKIGRLLTVIYETRDKFKKELTRKNINDIYYRLTKVLEKEGGK